MHKLLIQLLSIEKGGNSNHHLIIISIELQKAIPTQLWNF